MNFGRKKFDTQFTRTGKKIKYFMHGMQKLAVDVTFTHMKAKKGTKMNVESTVATMYNGCTILETMKVMGSLNPNSLTRPYNKG